MKDRIPTPNGQFLFVPLGGAGEIGMNMYLYGYGGKWLMVDCGITFGDEGMPAVDVVLPDPTFIADRCHELAGLIITHAHEDHLGAVAWLWPRLRCPVYATPFAAALLQNKLAEVGLLEQVPLTVVELGSRFGIGPFDVELVSLTHSIPEANAIAIRTDVGTVLHTGDWKFDPGPLVGRTADTDGLGRLGEAGVLAMVGDSTNVFTEGTSGSEADVRAALIDVVGEYHGRVAVTCFASNVARLESIALAAAAHGRRVALVGRSLWRIVEAARRAGYLDGSLRFFSDSDVADLPRDRVLHILTGSQGEPRSALARVAEGNHPTMRLGPGDVVLFSSRVIPGNDRAIFRLQNQIIRLGAKVLTGRDRPIHVSGHPARAEMKAMYGLVAPRIAVPIHGETRHLVAHGELARACGVETVVVAENGSVVRLGPGAPTVVGSVSTGRLAVDGCRILPIDSQILRNRKRMMFNGSAVVTVVVDAAGRLLSEPKLTAPGVIDVEDDADGAEGVVAAVRAAVGRLSASDLRNDKAIREAARLAVRRSFKESLGKKPVTDVHLVRL